MLEAFPPNGGNQGSVHQFESQSTSSALPGYTSQQHQQQQAEVMTDSPPPQYHPHGVEQTNTNDMEVDSVGSETRSRRATSVISMDDIEAAQALEGLRSEYTHTTVHTRAPNESTSQAPETTEPEPLLSLITSHPLLSSAINSSMSVYTSSKTYSPKFKYGAEFIERNIGSRVVNTVGSVGRRTGVEGGLRWALQRRESLSSSSKSNTNSNSNSSQGQAAETADIEKGMNDLRTSHSRRSSTLSSEPLPPYDNVSSPKYDELYKGNQQQQQSQGQYSWQNRLMISTSGLGVAMSEESLRSLTYCLTWLQWANTRIGTSVGSLKEALREWDSSNSSGTEDKASNEGDQQSPAVLSQQIQQVKGDVLQTLKIVVDVVSKYAGGALPENARNLVRRHLTSLPQRFRIAFNSNVPAEGSAPESDMRTRAFRVLVLAEEGLDMMGQVSKVVNDTLVSAENWCDTLRRPKPSANNNNNTQNMPQPPSFEENLDRKVPIPMPDQKDDVEMDG